MQVLFLWDAHAKDDPDAAGRVVAEGTDDPEVRRDALDMARSTWAQRETTDARVERVAPQWPPRRQPGVDRTLIRMAVWELTNADTPPKVVIDEAIELAKQFSTEQSPAFVNGVLDAVLKENVALVGEGTGEGPGFRVQGSGEEVGPPAPVAAAPAETSMPAEPQPAAAPLPAPAPRAEPAPAAEPGAGLRKIALAIDTDFGSLFAPGRRIGEDFLADMKVRFLEAGAGVDEVRQAVEEVRRRWHSGEIRTADQAAGVVREQITRAPGGAGE